MIQHSGKLADSGIGFMGGILGGLGGFAALFLQPGSC